MTDTASYDDTAMPGNAMALTEKQKHTLADYIGDMVLLQSHIEEALDSQKNEAKDNANVNQAIQRFHDMVKRNRDTLKAYQDQFGKQADKPIKAAGSALLGKAAGVIDKIRTEGISKDLRDDYAAFNMAAISYTMLETTAVAFGDTKTAELAKQGLRDYAKAVQEINRLIPDVVVWELEKDDHQVAAGTAAEVRRSADQIWKDTSDASAMSA
jgi:ferritin-like metal-binding protein YciE